MSGTSSAGVAALDSWFAVRGRKTLLDASAALTCLAVLVALTITWYPRLLDRDLGPILSSIAGCALLYVAASSAAGRLDDARRMARALMALQLLVIGALGIAWLVLGGMSLPAFLLTFLLPIIASEAAPLRWQTHVTTAVAVLVAGAVIVITSPEVRWTLQAGGLPTELLNRIADRVPGSGGIGLDAQPSLRQTGIWFTVFTVAAVAASVSSSTLAHLAARLGDRVAEAASAAGHAQGLAESLMAVAPLPSVLLDPATGRVLRASHSFSKAFGCSPEAFEQAPYTRLAGLVFADQLDHLGVDGSSGFVPYRVQDRQGALVLHSAGVEVGGRSLRYLTAVDATLDHELRLALESDGDPLILVTAADRVAWLNAAARKLFGESVVGMPAGRVLDPPSRTRGWWDPAPRREAERPVTLADQARIARIHSATQPGPDAGRLLWIRVSRDGR